MFHTNSLIITIFLVAMVIVDSYRPSLRISTYTLLSPNPHTSELGSTSSPHTKSLSTISYQLFPKVLYIFIDTKYTKRTIIPTSTLMASSYDIDILSDESYLKSTISRWYFLNKNMRCEVYVSKANSIEDIIHDLWKGTIITTNVQEVDEYNNQLVNVFVFPNIKRNNDDSYDDLWKYHRLAEDTMKSMNISYALFPSHQRYYEFEWKSLNDNTNMDNDSHTTVSASILLLSIISKRIKAKVISYNDWDLDEKTLSDNNRMEDLFISNEIKSFPFPTIFDFISEINRPIDLTSRTQSRFNFRVKDLKYDLKKMSNKVDPQEFVDVINCRLTRLAVWKEILERDRPELTDSFIPDEDWIEDIKAKYQSLQSLVKTNPKRALETQYNKQKVFIDIIDRWSDKLKRHFTYYFKSKGLPPEDFTEWLMNAKWRKEIYNNTLLFQKIPSLQFDVDFVYGEPEPLFTEDRVILWDEDYSVETASYEMIMWFHHINKVIAYTFDDSHNVGTYGTIDRQVYSRGNTVEQVMVDTWSQLSRWLNDVSGKSTRKDSEESKLLNVDDLMDVYQSYDINQSIDKKTHFDEYLTTLRKLNNFSRRESNSLGLTVKELYGKYYQDTTKGLMWFTDLLRNTSMEDEMYQVGYTRQPKHGWSYIIDSMMNYQLLSKSAEYRNMLMEQKTPWFLKEGNDTRLSKISSPFDRIEAAKLLHIQSDTEFEELSKLINITTTVSSYDYYRSKFRVMDYLVKLLPWTAEHRYNKLLSRFDQKTVDQSYSIDVNGLNEYILPILTEIKKSIYDDKVTNAKVIDTQRLENTNTATSQLLMVFPRFFRGTGTDQELSAFMVFFRMVESEIMIAGLNVALTPLHPLMVDFKTSYPAYIRRAPHPAILFTIKGRL